MITSFNINNKMTMISEMRGDSIFQVLEYCDLEGADDLNLSVQLDFMRKSSVRLKQIRMILNDSSVKIASGAMSYMKGELEIQTKTDGLIGLGRKFFASKVTDETMFKPIIKGTGEVFLEPSFGHYILLELEDEEIIVDDGLFIACEEGVKIEPIMHKSISSLLLDEDGVFQTKLSGSGIVALQIPVPYKEILRCKLFRDTLKVDGSFVILRSANVEFTIEPSGTSLIGTAINGEGFLNVYRGTGEVWLVPTEPIYEKLRDKGIKELKELKRYDNMEN
ncbi:MAG: AIM24 family protein [Clostridium sp.]|nr:AIM24 family protein [Clostridium sp.]